MDAHGKRPQQRQQQTQGKAEPQGEEGWFPVLPRGGKRPPTQNTQKGFLTWARRKLLCLESNTFLGLSVIGVGPLLITTTSNGKRNIYIQKYSWNKDNVMSALRPTPLAHCWRPAQSSCAKNTPEGSKWVCFRIWFQKIRSWWTAIEKSGG